MIPLKMKSNGYYFLLIEFCTCVFIYYLLMTVSFFICNLESVGKSIDIYSITTLANVNQMGEYITNILLYSEFDSWDNFFFKKVVLYIFHSICRFFMRILSLLRLVSKVKVSSLKYLLTKSISYKNGL